MRQQIYVTLLHFIVFIEQRANKATGFHFLFLVFSLSLSLAGGERAKDNELVVSALHKQADINLSVCLSKTERQFK